MHPLRVTLLVALAAAAGCGDPEPPALDPSSHRVLPAGEVVGISGASGGHVWRALPYARPPLGPLRWRAPQPLPRWEGSLPASRPGAPCPQLASPLAGVESADAGEPVGEEDCLTLDVYAPRLGPAQVPAGGQRLPVMVWIHGGGNVVGFSDYYDGGNLAVGQNVVVVAIQYRLGPLGWFRHAALRAEGGTAEDLSGNYGTLDQIRALEWVRENISAFGGDPARVTIFGESAGGRNVFALLLSPRARGLFQRAIIQSGGTKTLPVHRAENRVDDPPPGHPNSSAEVLQRLLSDDPAKARAQLSEMSPARVVRFLRELDAATLLEAYRSGDSEGMDVPQLFRDGAVLPLDEPLEVAARRGGAAPVPVMLGTTRDEQRLFLAFDERLVESWLWIAPQPVDPPRYLATAQHLSDMWRATAVDEPAAALRRGIGPQVWSYRFDWDEQPKLFFGQADVAQLVGAGHGMEIPFVFDHWKLGSRSHYLFDEANRPGREELAAKVMSYWAEFAYSGAPGSGRGGELPQWTPWQAAGSGFLALDTEADGGVRMEAGIQTRARVIEAVAADARLPEARQRCDVLFRLARWGRGFGPEQYPEVADRACAEFPYDRWPWEN